MREFLKFTGLAATAATRPRRPRHSAGIFDPWLRHPSLRDRFPRLNGGGINLRDAFPSLNPAAISLSGRFPSLNPRVTRLSPRATSLNDGSTNRRETTPPTSGATAPTVRLTLFPPSATT